MYVVSFINSCLFVCLFVCLGVFIWRRASPLGRASPLCRDPASQLNSLSNFIFVYMREGPALLGGISPRRAGNFPYKRT